jgi:hypothetical protein
MPHGFYKPNFYDSAFPILQHFERQRHESPDDTHTIIILSRLHPPIGKSWLPVFSKYKRIHSNLAGTYLFHAATCATASTPMGPTRWPADVYLAKHIVEEWQGRAWDNASRPAHLKALFWESQGKEYTPRTITKKSHQPRLLTTKQHIKSLNDHKLLLLAPSFLTHELVPPPTMFY